MKRKLMTLGLLTVLSVSVLATSAPSPTLAAQHSASHAAVFDKTRFAIHLGLAYFAFHHFVYVPYKHGDFKKGAPHRTGKILKAGAALLITYHELKLAYNIAKGSNSHILKALIKPLSALTGKASSIANSLRGGQYSDKQVGDLTNSANSFSRQATSSGISIKDIPVPGLGS